MPKRSTKTPLKASSQRILTNFIMIAVAQIGGHQALVKKGDVLSVDKIDVENGKTVEFPVLMVSESDGNNFQMGTPLLSGVTVKAKVLDQYKDEKVTTFKMKPRKRYRRTIGHRTQLTKIEITEIKVSGSSPKTAAKKEAEPKAEKPAPQKEASQTVKKTAQK